MVDEKRISKGFWVWGQFDEASTEIITNFYESFIFCMHKKSNEAHRILNIIFNYLLPR